MDPNDQFADSETHALHDLTVDYGDHIVVSRQHQGPSIANIPAWTPFRAYLSEGLDYIEPGNSSECIANGAVIACIVGRDAGDRTYLDSEVAIFRICTSGTSHLNTRDHKEKRRRAILDAWEHTREARKSLVLLQGPGFNASTVHLAVLKYVVLDHFRVSLIWAERGEDGRLQHMVRLEKCNLRLKSWWTPKQPDPPAYREFFGQTAPSMTNPCNTCGRPSPWVYNEAQLCLEPLCPAFWTDVNGDGTDETVPARLTFATSLLLYRSNLNSQEQQQQQEPTFPLVRDIVREVSSLATSSALVSSGLLLHGIICPQCRAIVPKIYWHIWRCDACAPESQRDYPCNPGIPGLEALVTRDFVSYEDHPNFNFAFPRVIGENRPRAYRDQFTVDRWTLRHGCQLLVLSPTRMFNELAAGPNDLFISLARDANSGNLGLHRYRYEEPPPLANHFQSTWGAEYGFQGFLASQPVEEAPPSIPGVRELLEQVANSELGDFPGSNSVQVFGFMQGQGLEWHTDGEGELGDTISILNLGGDATFKLRHQRPYYKYIDLFQEGQEVFRGVINWEQATADQDMLAHGQSTSSAASSAGLFAQALPDKGSAESVVASVPLIHGSIVILQGSAFSRYYEHCLDTHGPLTFQAITRIIDEQKHHELILERPENYSARPNGMLFTASSVNSEDEDDEEDDDDNEESEVESEGEDEGDGDGEDDFLDDMDRNESPAAPDSDAEADVSVLLMPPFQHPQPPVQHPYQPHPGYPPPQFGHGRGYQFADAGRTQVGSDLAATITSGRGGGGGGSNTWTAALENRLVEMHNSGLTYVEIREADEQLGRWSITALSTAYKRIMDRRKRGGGRAGGGAQRSAAAAAAAAAAASHAQTTWRRNVNASAAGTGTNRPPRPRRSPQPASHATGSGKPWTQEELDQLWDLRHRVPPLSYAEIERVQGHRRTEKAYREQMVLEKKKRAQAANSAVGESAAARGPAAGGGTPVAAPSYAHAHAHADWHDRSLLPPQGAVEVEDMYGDGEQDEGGLIR